MLRESCGWVRVVIEERRVRDRCLERRQHRKIKVDISCEKEKGYRAQLNDRCTPAQCHEIGHGDKSMQINQAHS